MKSCGYSPDNSRIVSGAEDNTMRVWDAATGALLATHYHLPQQCSAVIDEQAKTICFAHKKAWRWLGYHDHDPESGAIRRWPAEIHGPLPG